MERFETGLGPPGLDERLMHQPQSGKRRDGWGEAAEEEGEGGLF